MPRQLIDALSDAGVEQAMFFVTTRNVESLGESGQARLRAYSDAGHVLANHSHSHHVLLLHENDVAALFLGGLVAELRNQGFRIIPATVAFSDPIAEREPDTLFLNQGRIAALAHEAGWERSELVSPTEDEEHLRGRFEAEVATLPAR